MSEEPQRRQCVATKADGTRCRRWALIGAQRCFAHTPDALTPPDARRCQAQTAKGTRCRAWALSGRTLCATHAGLGGFAPGHTIHWKDTLAGEPPPDVRRCTARMVNGERCPNWRMVGNEDRLCATHAGSAGFREGHLLRWKHGGYMRRVLPHEVSYYEQERAAYQRGEHTLALEIAAGRYILGRIVETYDPATTPLRDLLEAAALVFHGTTRIAFWLETERLLTSEQDEALRAIAYEMLAAGTLEEEAE